MKYAMRALTMQSYGLKLLCMFAYFFLFEKSFFFCSLNLFIFIVDDKIFAYIYMLQFTCLALVGGTARISGWCSMN